MTERYYAVDAGEGVWVYKLELEGYESAVKVEGALLMHGQVTEGPKEIPPEDFVRNVANNGMRQTTGMELRIMKHEEAEEVDLTQVEFAEQDDLDQVNQRYEETETPI